MQRRWTINGRFLTQPMTGVQRYAHEIVCAMDSLMAEQHPLARGLEIEILVPPGAESSAAARLIESRSVGSVGGHAWEQAVLPASLNGGGLLSLCNTGPVTANKHIVCIHDANVWNAPQSYSLAFRGLYRVLLPALGRTAWGVATVSSFSQKGNRPLRDNNVRAQHSSRRTATNTPSGGSPVIRKPRVRPLRATRSC